MLSLVYETSDRHEQLVLTQNLEPFLILRALAEKELEAVEVSLCSLTPGPDLNLEYAITQQRRICLIDLIQFFKTLIEEHTAGE